MFFTGMLAGKTSALEKIVNARKKKKKRKRYYND